jgi:hypothetical protein
MRTSKKMIAGVSAFIVAVSSIAMTVSAVDTESSDFTVSVSVDKESVATDGQIELSVNLANVPDTGIAGFEFAVSFDSSALTLVSVEENADVVGTASAEEERLVPALADTMLNDGGYSCFDYYVSDDKIACMWATGLDDSSYWINTDGTVATFVFAVNEGTDADSVELGIVPIHDNEDSEIVFAAADDSGNYYAYDSVNQGDNVVVEISDDGTAGSDTEEPDDTTAAGEDTEEPDDTTEGSGEEGGEVTTTAGEDTDEPDDTTAAKPTTGSSEGGLKGDVNDSGDVNSVDLVLVKKYLLTMIDGSALNLTNADVNNSGDVNSVDLLFIKKYLLTMIDSLENLG